MSNIMKTRGFLMSVKPEQCSEFLEHAGQKSPELLAAMEQFGVHKYNLFLDQSSYLLFAYLEYESDERLIQLTNTEACQDWWEHMGAYMPTNSDHSPISTDLLRVFHLDED